MKRFLSADFRPAVGVRFLRPDHGRGEPGREQADAGASENHPHTALHHGFRHRILRCAALPAGLAVGSARWRRPFQLPAPQFHQRIPPCDLVLRHDPRSRTPQRSPLHPPCGILPCQPIFDTTRLFGDVPYTEAAQGRFDDPNFSPKYDPQEEIVAGLLRSLQRPTRPWGTTTIPKSTAM